MEISLPERERSTTDLLYSVFTENTWDTNHLLYVTRITEFFVSAPHIHYIGPSV